MIPRAILIAAALAAHGASAQETGSMEVRIGEADRTFLILDEEQGTDMRGSTGERLVTLVAAPDAGGGATDPQDPDGRPTLTLTFVVEGVGSSVSASGLDVAFEEPSGRVFVPASDVTSALDLTTFAEIGEAFAATGEFSSELVPEGGEEGSLLVSGSFQATIESD